jgi:hypothetical protein
MNLGGLRFLALIAATFALPEAAGAAFSCEKKFISCKKVQKTALKTTCSGDNKRQCTGEVQGNTNFGCNPFFIDDSLTANADKEYHPKDTNPDGDHYVYTAGMTINPTDDKMRVPFPVCVNDSCQLYKMSDVPKYRK